MKDETGKGVPDGFRLSWIFVLSCIVTRILAGINEWSGWPISLADYMQQAGVYFVCIWVLCAISFVPAIFYNEHLDEYGTMRKHPALRNAHMIALYFLVNAAIWYFWVSRQAAPPTIAEQYELEEIINMYDTDKVDDFVRYYVLEHYRLEDILELFGW